MAPSELSRRLRTLVTSGGRRGVSLRVRLTVIYLLLAMVLLLGVGWVFSQVLQSILTQRADKILNGEWAALRGYLTVRNGKADWDSHVDREEVAIVARLRRVLHVASLDGTSLEISAVYQELGAETAAEMRSAPAGNSFKTRRTPNGESYRIRQGIITDDGQSYFVAIGYPIAEDQRVQEQFRTAYMVLVPLLLLGMGVIGWLAAGRALRPVNEVVTAAQSISANNLSVRLLPTGSGDELDTLIRTFNNMLERLEANFEQIRQFSIDASHELRTPLTSIRGQLEVALMSAQTVEQHREAMFNALQDGERLTQIVKSLLLLAQAESGQIPLQKSEVDLSVAVEDLVSQFEISATDRQITIIQDVSPGCRAHVDRIQFDRLASNLLSNAIKFTRNGGTVRVMLEPADARVRLVVEDTGPGIPQDHLPRIFERFYRVPGEQADGEKGLGLGLSFVHWIVHAHSGEIRVSSQPGEGSVFEVLLPVA